MIKMMVVDDGGGGDGGGGGGSVVAASTTTIIGVANAAAHMGLNITCVPLQSPWCNCNGNGKISTR